MIFNGMQVKIVDYPFESETNIPKRRSKKKRTQKKFNKKYGFLKKIDYKILVYDNTIICHSKTLEKILKQIDD